MIKVRTDIFDDHWVGATEVQVNEVLFRKTVIPLDLPAPNRPAAACMFCSDSVTIKMVMRDRKVLAKEISEAITRQLLEFMSKQDTVMGYKVYDTDERNPQES